MASKKTNATKQVPRLVEHLLTQQFGDRGTFGGNQTDAIYLVASLSEEDRDLFLGQYLVKCRDRLKELLDDKKMALSEAEAQEGFEKFADFNPKFVGGFHLDW